MFIKMHYIFLMNRKIMNKFLINQIVIIVLTVFSSAFNAFSQVGINTDGALPDSSAILDMKSTEKGFLPPRMTREQRNSLTTPTAGMIIFCTDCADDGSGVLSIYSNGVWSSFESCLTPDSPVAGTHVPYYEQIVWNWDTVSGATGYKWNTTDDYATATDMLAVTTKTETGLACNTPYNRYVWAYNACGTSAATTLTATTLACWVCGDPVIINHVMGSVAPVDKTVTYGTVANIPGETSKCWITSNLGADHQATAVNDDTEASAGWYWQFNRNQGYKHDGTARTPNSAWTSYIDEDSDWTTANDPCNIELSNGWRIPTYTEWANVDASGGWISWNGPWNSGLKLHAAGCLSYSGGSLNYRGLYGYYWSSLQYGTTKGNVLYFGSGISRVDSNVKAYGFAVRCVRDN